MPQHDISMMHSDAAGFALMLITWARGGQLGRRGKGYQVAFLSDN